MSLFESSCQNPAELTNTRLFAAALKSRRDLVPKRMDRSSTALHASKQRILAFGSYQLINLKVWKAARSSLPMRSIMSSPTGEQQHTCRPSPRARQERQKRRQNRERGRIRIRIQSQNQKQKNLGRILGSLDPPSDEASNPNPNESPKRKRKEPLTIDQKKMARSNMMMMVQAMGTTPPPLPSARPPLLSDNPLLPPTSTPNQNPLNRKRL